MESNRPHVEFLKGELALGFTFALIASQRLEAGNRTQAEKSLDNAEKAYETVLRFMSDAKYSKQLTSLETEELTAQREKLRKKLEALRKSESQVSSG